MMNKIKIGKRGGIIGGLIGAAVAIYAMFMVTHKTAPESPKPEPAGWYAGDMHVHRNCGEFTKLDDSTSILAENRYIEMLKPNNLAVMSLLADMGNGEVQDPVTDLPKVNGEDAPQSVQGRIIHWDAEWHWDATYSNFDNQALGGHLVLLGLKEAHQIWDESPYKILEWGKAQGAVVGFCHMQYLNDSIQNNLDCCIPIDFPVEAALGTIDFVAEDVWINDAAVNAYYKLLNCGFRPGLAAGTDFPCNGGEPLGSLLTYVQVNGPLTYRKWIEGIKNGRTVIAHGHTEFLDIKVNEALTPGDELILNNSGTVPVEVRWSDIQPTNGSIEIIQNGKVVAKLEGSSGPGKPLVLKTELSFPESGWICARRMGEKGHQSHTAPVFVTVKGKPVRASADDARFFIAWIDNIVKNIQPGKPWNRYFTHDLDKVEARYNRARDIYSKILQEVIENQTGQ